MAGNGKKPTDDYEERIQRLERMVKKHGLTDVEPEPEPAEESEEPKPKGWGE